MKKLILTFALILSFATGLVACSNPNDAPLPSDLAKMEQIKPTLDKLQPEDRELLAGYLTRRAFAGTLLGAASTTDSMTAKTVGEAIDQQRIFIANERAKEAAQKAADEQLAAKRDAATKALQALVTVGLVSKKIEAQNGVSGIEIDRVLAVEFSFTNHSQKDISGVKGLLIARDLFGDDISAFQISNDDTIKAGAQSVWRGSRSVRFALGNNHDEKFADLPADKFTLVWKPQVIVFTDGTKVTVPS